MAVLAESSEATLASDSEARDGGPLPMKFFSTWEILQPIEPGLQSVVVSVSMKTPHRSLRSNELEVPVSGTMNIPQNLTFTLEYPHFLKRGGNDLQIRLQRKKRYRNRTIRGYKTLARGEVNMALVLQKSFHGVVKLFSEKNPEPLATVTVSSLTSTPAENETHPNDVGASSEEEEDEIIFSDELAERGSDTDSLENMDPEDATVEALPKLSLKQPSSVLRLLKLRASGNRRRVPEEVTLGLEEDEAEGAESVATSLSDSYEEEEALSHGQTTPRPRLRPFFGSDTLSQLSMPQPGDVEILVEDAFQRHDLVTNNSRTRSRSPSEALQPLDMPESALIEGRLWLVKESINNLLMRTLQSLGEPFLATPTECTSSSLLSLFNTLYNLWHRSNPFLLLVTGNKYFLSALLRAYVTAPSFPIWLFLWLDTEKKFRSSSPLLHVQEQEDKEQKYSEDSISRLLGKLKEHLHYQPMPIAQADLSIETTTPEAKDSSRSIPFIESVIMGPWESDTDLVQPVTSPSSPSSNISEHHEIQLEYWGGKKDSQKSTVKVRSVMVSVVDGPLLNITAITRKKGVIRIRRSKDSTGESSIMSLTASHLSCRSTKSEAITAVIDGVEWQSLMNIKLSAQWNHTSMSSFPRATCQSPLTQ